MKKQSLMTSVLAISTLLSFSLRAAAAISTAEVNDLAKKAEVSNHCARQVLSQATAQCNKESLAKEQGQREHACEYSYDMTGYSMAHPNEGKLEVVFTAGDSDEWSYIVSITDEADANDCTFTIDSENN